MATKECVACAEQIQENAKLCKHCGTMQHDSRFDESQNGTPNEFTSAMEVTEGKTNPGSGAKCPVCGKDDATQAIGTIIDSGVTSTSGRALTVGRNLNYAVSGYNSVSVSNLANRLAGPPQPTYSVFGTYVFATLVTAALVYGAILGTPLLRPIPEANALGAGLTGVAALTVGGFISLFALNSWVTTVNRQRKMATRIEKWNQSILELRNSRYCSRDDICFDGQRNGKPEAYIRDLFSEIY